MFECEATACQKGGRHKERFLATACRLYHQYYGHGAKAVHRTAQTVLGVPKAAQLAIIGTGQTRKAVAKSLKIRGFSRLSTVELDDAIHAAQAGQTDRVHALEAIGLERARASWTAWRAKAS